MTKRVITSVLAASLFAGVAMLVACGEEEKKTTPATKETPVSTEKAPVATEKAPVATATKPG